MKYHVDGCQAQAGEIFVFGSNLSGIHGAGAARAAHRFYGAEIGVGIGPTGRSYAIPTVNERISGTLPLDRITEYVHEFKEYARANPDKTFFVTAIGCGIAGYTHAQIAPLFKDAPDNCDFPEPWKAYL